MIWLVLALALGIRLLLTLSHDGYLGVDGGAYLLSYNTVLGNEPTGAGFPRPPLAPGWLLVPFVETLGVDVGYKVWSALASLAPVVPVYLFSRRIGVLPSIFAAGFILLDLNHAEMIVTGALPLLAFGLLGTAWWAMSSLVERWSWKVAGLLAACVGLIPWVNQTTAGLALVTIPIFALALLWYNRKSAAHQRDKSSALAPAFTSGTDPGWAALFFSPTSYRLWLPLAAGGLIALGALPWYLQVLPGTGLLHYPGRFLYLTNWADSSWWQLAIAWPLGLWMLRKGETLALRALGVLVCLLGTLLVFMSTDETVLNVFYRSRYLLAIPWFIGITWVVFTRWLPMFRENLIPHWVPVTATALAVGAMLFGYQWMFHRQAQYSDMATPSNAEALAFIQRTDPGAGVVNNSFTLALWISALNKVPSPHTWTWTPPAAWTETDKDVRCLLGWVPECKPIEAKARLGVGYVLIDSRFPYYNKRAPGIYGAPNVAEPWANLSEVAWLEPVFRQGTTTLWRINLYKPAQEAQYVPTLP